MVPEVGEVQDGKPIELVVENARRKAQAAVAAAPAGALVIAGDTEVALDGRCLGQPADEAAAREMLGVLSGRTHEVLGALAVLDTAAGVDAGLRTGCETSAVTFRRLDAALLDAYLASGEWRGRAGGYAIQGLGSALVERVEGDVSNVIGLPIPLLLGLAPGLIAP